MEQIRVHAKTLPSKMVIFPSCSVLRSTFSNSKAISVVPGNKKYQHSNFKSTVTSIGSLQQHSNHFHCFTESIYDMRNKGQN